MIPLPRRIGFRLAAMLTAGSLAAGCAPVGPGIYQQQASNAAYACQQGIMEACQDYQALAPAANAEVYQQQQEAQVGTAVAAGLVGAIAGAAIASSTRSRRDYHGYRGRYDGPRGRYYHRGYYR
ncbi:MAG TPA: hypothetical protein VIL69_07835 [Roseomonas sp.]|jgi:hypothetical protein